ncbi:beta-2 adrenergic receptor-like [Acropora muricata]|uniref:beta-2 adrenergic receptor-like n=1 Tax=Acropora muricata TaxID=159855 RepID=UPI0010FCCDE0|nr:probable G-protein coupled receptor No9 [Acropora millepora]XP_029212213.1 probable G-protein coupled receptor No9 [Acropora millepora]
MLANYSGNTSTDAVILQGSDGTVVFLIVVSVLIIATVVGNGFVFMAVYTFRDLRTVTNYFVLSLASADLAVALLAMPVWLISSLIPLESEDQKLMLDLSTKWIDPFCCTASIINATLVSIDRYYAISKPLHYKTVVTPRRARRSIAMVWGFAIVIALITFLQYHDDFDVIHGYVIFLFVTLFCLPLAIMSFAYISIYRAAVHQLSKMRNTRPGSRPGLTNTEQRKRYFYSFERRKRFFRELKITKMLAIIVSLFIICWSPFLIVTLIEAFTAHDIPLVVEGIIVFLPYVLSCANPWIYTGMNRDFRVAFKKLFCNTWKICLRCQEQKDRKSRLLKSLPSITVDETFISNGSRNSQTRISARRTEIILHITSV